MVPVEGIEPPTFGLQNRCSTAELNRQTREPRFGGHLSIFASPVNPSAAENARKPYAVAASIAARRSGVTIGRTPNQALKAGRA